MQDLFDKIYKNKGPLGKWASIAEGYFVFPKLEGPISNRMMFNGKEVITWSVNDYLGLANNPEVREVDAKASQMYGSAYPMGARMMSGHTEIHEKLEEELAEFVNKESAYVLNFGYQGILSTAETLSIFHLLFNNFSISLFKSVLNPKTNEFKYSSFNDLISNSFSKSPLIVRIPFFSQ